MICSRQFIASKCTPTPSVATRAPDRRSTLATPLRTRSVARGRTARIPVGAEPGAARRRPELESRRIAPDARDDARPGHAAQELALLVSAEAKSSRQVSGSDGGPAAQLRVSQCLCFEPSEGASHWRIAFRRKSSRKGFSWLMVTTPCLVFVTSTRWPGDAPADQPAGATPR